MRSGRSRSGIWRLFLLGLAVLALFLPGVVCLTAGGWLSLPGLGALLVWLGLGRWVWQAWQQWRQNNFEDYV